MYVNIYRLNIYIFSLKEFVAKTAICVPNVPVLILLTGRTLILCCFVDTIKADCLYQPSLKLGMSVTQNHGQWNERNSGQHLPGNQRKQQVYTLCSFCFVPSSTLYTSQGAPADIPAPWGRAPPWGWWHNEQRTPWHQEQLCGTGLPTLHLPTSCRRQRSSHPSCLATAILDILILTEEPDSNRQIFQ